MGPRKSPVRRRSESSGIAKAADVAGPGGPGTSGGRLAQLTLPQGWASFFTAAASSAALSANPDVFVVTGKSTAWR